MRQSPTESSTLLWYEHVVTPDKYNYGLCSSVLDIMRCVVKFFITSVFYSRLYPVWWTSSVTLILTFIPCNLDNINLSPEYRFFFFSISLCVDWTTLIEHSGFFHGRDIVEFQEQLVEERNFWLLTPRSPGCTLRTQIRLCLWKLLGQESFWRAP